MPDSTFRIVFAGGGSGGHIYPGVAVARALRELAPGTQALFLGSDRPLETRILEPTGFEHHALPSAPWRGARNLPALMRFGWEQLRGAARARGILKEFQPHVVLGLGGFASVPGVVAAKTLRTPVALFEPNAVAGRANQVLAHVAREAYVQFEETSLSCVCQRTGVPIGERALSGPERTQARRELGLPTHNPVVLVMGGSQGARGINRWIAEAVGAGAVPRGVSFLHLAGNEEAAAELRGAYRAAGVDHVVLPFLSEIGVAYTAADLAIVRAGAATIAELSACGIPGLAIPLHGLAGGHQERNAKAYSASGAGAWIPESALSAETLARVCAEAKDATWVGIRSRLARAVGTPEAAQSVARRLLRLGGHSVKTPARSDRPEHHMKRAA